MDRRTRRAGGVFYTPEAIADAMVSQALASLPLQGHRPLRVLDPACGDGAFLRSVNSYLPDALLYGVDLDPHAIEAAKTNVPGVRLRQGDALLDFPWEAQFPEVFAGPDPGFDLVIGNPPWVSLAGRFGTGDYTEAEVAYLTRRYQGNSYLPNLYEFFITLGLELTRPGGCLSYIVPDRLGHNDQFAALRQRLLRETTLLSLQYNVPFPGVTADTLIFLLRKTPATAAQSFTQAAPSLERLPHVAALSELCDTTSGFGGKSQLITSVQTAPTQIPVLKGESIGRYETRHCFWFEFDRRNLTGRTTDRKKLGATPKILLRKTGDRLMATLDESGMYPEQSLYFLYNKRTAMDYRFILGVLNSATMHEYFRAKALTNPGSIPQVKKTHLDQLPVPVLAPNHPWHLQLIALVTERLQGHTTLDPQIDALVQRIYEGPG